MKRVDKSKPAASGVPKDNTIKSKTAESKVRNTSTTSSSADSKLSSVESFNDRWGLDARPPKRSPSPPTPQPPLPKAALPLQLKDKKIELQRMVIDEQRNRLR